MVEQKMRKYLFGVLFSVVILGSFSFDVYAQYGNGYYGAGDYNGVQDIVAPVISSISTSLLSSSGATIVWTTDETATSQVVYGLTTSYTATTTLDPSLVTSHSVALSSLASSTTYHYRVISKDASNNTSTSSDNTFTTTANVAVVDNDPTTTPGSFSSSGSSIVLVRQMNSQRALISVQNDLSVGSSGESVKALQNFLIYRGFLGQGNNTGFFGPLTKSALVSYQRATKISPATGLFGPLTRAAVKVDQTVYYNIASTTSTTFKNNLKFGDINEDIRLLQKFLNKNNFLVSKSGPGSVGQETNYFGLNTKNALLKFQESYAIKPASGELDEVTRVKINSLK
jgi:hypothetical protein